MSVAYLTADFEAVSSIFSDPDKFVKADPFPFLLTALIVLTFGPGLYSIDTVLKRWITGVPFVRSDSSAGHPFRQAGERQP
jgi:putative oxidoreductase